MDFQMISNYVLGKTSTLTSSTTPESFDADDLSEDGLLLFDEAVEEVFLAFLTRVGGSL